MPPSSLASLLRQSGTEFQLLGEMRHAEIYRPYVGCRGFARVVGLERATQDGVTVRNSEARGAEDDNCAEGCERHECGARRDQQERHDHGLARERGWSTEAIACGHQRMGLLSQRTD